MSFKKYPYIQLNNFKYKAVQKTLIVKTYQCIDGKIIKEYL